MVSISSLESRLSSEDQFQTTEQLETHQMIQEMEKISLLNEKLLITQMSLLMDDDCNTQMAVEYCSLKQTTHSNRSIKAKKITNDAATIALYQSTLAALRSGSQKNETLLFYYGHHEHLDIIAHAGFTQEGQYCNGDNTHSD